MKEAPERIWLLWADGLIENRYQASATDHTEEGGCREFIRLDAHEAAVAAARKEGMLAARDIALADEANDWTDGVPRGGIIAEAIDDAIAAEASK